MDITTDTSLLPQPVTQPTRTTEISSDFETFLKMLTVQLQNQDPLNPVEAADYAVQLATFSGVEQQVQTNELLKQLSAQLGTGGITQLAGWVGMEARAPAAASFVGDPIGVRPVVAQGASAAEIIVRNANGYEVDRFVVGLDGQTVNWTGRDALGNPLPLGTYRFDTLSYDGDAFLAENQAEVYSRVREVQLRDGAPVLILASGEAISADAVSALREDSLQ